MYGAPLALTDESTDSLIMSREISLEREIIMSNTEYRVWLETGDLIEVFDTQEEAQERAELERTECPCGTSGADGECGVIHPHGISVQVCRDGYDVTGEC